MLISRRAVRCALVLVICCCIPVVFVYAQDEAPSDDTTPSGSAINANGATNVSVKESSAGAAAGTEGESESSSKSQTNALIGQTTPAVQPGQTGRDVSEGEIFSNILQDQKDLWLFPLKMSREDHWLPTVIVAGVTAGLLTADAHDAPFFRQTRVFNDFNHAFPSTITMSEVVAAPASFYAVGLLTKDPYARKTGLLAGEALADVTILSEVMKAVTRQTRPVAIPPRGNFSDTFFNAKGDPFSSGFPSGHTISAFAVATVIADRYGKRHRWVPFLAYGAAALIGFSRVSTQAHFPSDVFVGAALGYAVAQFDVLHFSWGSRGQ
jgi:membrane-associated phospholipid phosphatase